MVLRLDAAVREFAEQIGVGVGLATEKLAIDVHGKLTMKTPVDTGRARASWLVCVGEPDTTTVPGETGKEPRKRGEKAPESPPSLPDAPWPDVTIDGTEPVFVISNLDYMEALENGHSGQAPSGMINTTLLEVEAELEIILAELKKP